MASKAEEEELRRLSVEMRFLEQTANTIQTRINMINAAIADLTYANAALEGLEKKKPNAELLVPIGGSSYVRAKLEDTDKVIVGVGAGVSVEKTLPETKETITKRLEDLEKARLSLQTQFSQVVDKIDESRTKAESLVTQIQQGKA